MNMDIYFANDELAGSPFVGRIVVSDPSLIREDTANEFQVRARLNNIRRVLLVEQELPAIDKVVFDKNRTNLTDEIIAIRLGQIPLTVDERFSRQSIENTPIRFHVQGPGQFRASDLQFPPGVYIRDEQQTFIERCVLCQLSLSAVIQGVAYIRWGSSLRHAKYQCISSVFFDLSRAKDGIAVIVFSTDDSVRADSIWQGKHRETLRASVMQAWQQPPSMRLPMTLLRETDSASVARMSEHNEVASAEDDSMIPVGSDSEEVAFGASCD